MEVYIYLGLYVVLILGLSYFVGKKSTHEDFLIAGRNRNWMQIMSSKFASSIGMSFFIAYTAYAYQYGFGIFYLFITIIISYTFFAIWAVPKIFINNKKSKNYTHGHWVESKLQSSFAKKLSDWFIIIQALLWYFTAIIGGGKTLEFLGIVSYEYAVGLTSIVILIYILMAGFKVVILTDIIQAIIIFLLMGLIIYNLPIGDSIQSLMVADTESIPLSLIIGFFVYGIFSIFSSVDRIPLIFASKTTKDAQKGMLLGTIPVVLMMAMLLFVGVFIFSQNSGLDPDMAFMELFRYLPETLFSLAAVMLFAGLMSSADTNVYLISSFLAMMNTKKDAVKRTRIFSIGVVVLGSLVAMIFPTVLGVTIFAAGFSMILSIAIIYIIAGGRKKEKFFSSLCLAFVSFIAGLFIVGIDPSIAVFPILGGAVGLLIPVSFFNKNKVKTL